MIPVSDSDLQTSIATLKKIAESNFVTLHECDRIRKVVKVLQEILEESAIIADERPRHKEAEPHARTFTNSQGRIV